MLDVGCAAAPAASASACAGVGPRPVRRERSSSTSASSRVQASRANSAGASIAGCSVGLRIQRLQLRQAFGGDPQAGAVAARATRASRAAVLARSCVAASPSPAGIRRAASARGDDAEAHQRLVHLVGVARLAARLPRAPRRSRPDRGGRGRRRCRRRRSGALMHRLRAALLQRRVVEEGVRPRVEHFGRERRRRGQVARDDRRPRRASMPRSSAQPAFGVHRLVQAVVAASARPAGGRAPRARRRGSRRTRPGRGTPSRAGPRDFMRCSCGATFLPPEKRGSASAVVAFQRQRTPNSGASSSACTSTSRGGRRMQVARDLDQREAVAGRQRQHDRVLGRRRLQLEVELAAEALAQRQAPGAVDAAAVGRVDDQLRAAGLVEEALHARCVCCVGSAPSAACVRAEVVDELAPPASSSRPTLVASATSRRGRRSPSAARSALRDLRAQARHAERQLVAAARRFAEPERDARRRALRVLDAHAARLDAQDAVAGVAELEDVAGQALDREVLVDGADRDAPAARAPPRSRRCRGWCRPR